jgi:hypothetical protein
MVGRNLGSITDSYVTGDVVASVSAGFSPALGGFVGVNFGVGSTISNSFSTADVTLLNPGAEGTAAGFVTTSNGTITNSYSSGDVVSDASAFGFLFSNNGGVVEDSFWDTQTSGQAVSDGGTGKTTAEMKSVTTFTDTDTAGLTTPWDFLGNPNDDDADEEHWSIDPGVRHGN